MIVAAPIPPRGVVPLIQSFEGLEDPRIDRNKEHKLITIIVMAICAVIAGCEDWVEIAEFADAKSSWFATFLPVGESVPSHDTFGRVFALLDAKGFTACFMDWIQAIVEESSGRIISVDGKTVRRSHKRTIGKDAIHMVSAWCNVNELVLGQIKVNDKSNEITAVPELLKLLSLEGCTVTADAMSCQKEIVRTVIEQKADYCIALKENQKTLYEGVKDTFIQALADKTLGKEEQSYHRTVNKNHGRFEVREYYTIATPEIITYLDPNSDWAGLTTIGMVHATRTIGDKTSDEYRYYLLSGSKTSAEFAVAVRSHWGVENNLHWMLDVIFNEDQSRVRTNTGRNLCVVVTSNSSLI